MTITVRRLDLWLDWFLLFVMRLFRARRHRVAPAGRPRLLVSNDNRPLHFAAACDLPCVDLYGPLSRGMQVLFAGFPCSPCLNIFRGKLSHCRGNRCLTAITVGQVAAGVRACWAS